ncbi:MAG: 2-oxoglutarate dehydrogenase complex dihydrolipoyllysine-residue succinyltransferase [Verrucomicrobia bacterium]|jgi:2-oxoglutarate dehydrogenase E2 component (dihydrolipoamide succinyltransferase)|nr:2-oxoglutarate dehydrogenase complex dihydrolipoyllysine-residue succinyltransferase [Verrucomicrobiota bacterium]
MATEVKIPALGESISSGILATWHVGDGDHVEQGQTLFDLETDKITSEGTAEASGTIHLKVEEGDEVEIGAVVAEIDESGEKPASKPSTEEGKEAEGKAPAEEKAAGEAASPQDAGPYPPAVRRIAAESGLDPSKVTGTGKGGRVTKADMEKAVREHEAAGKESPPARDEEEKPRAAPPPSEQDAAPPREAARGGRRKMSPIRRTISQRLVEAQQTTAMLTTFNEVDMSAVIGFRKQHQEAFVERHGIKLGFMSFFTKAVVHALGHVPGLGERIEGEEIVSPAAMDIGIAVSAPKGLMVPVVRGCEGKSFARIEQDIAEYASRAREGKITMQDLEGGIFTITNGGIFGSMLSTPILNTPQSGILGMHTIQQRPVVVDGEIVIRPMMYLALSYDHRLVDGKEAVTFLVKVKEAIEDPSRLLFEI